ncbi:hypothetical protein SUGI_0576200 [Cryptomeria japonica]|nr:hypothetical protein SUGI_0576200 [Cryptomeria japonica]
MVSNVFGCALCLYTCGFARANAFVCGPFNEDNGSFHSFSRVGDLDGMVRTKAYATTVGLGAPLVLLAILNV